MIVRLRALIARVSDSLLAIPLLLILVAAGFAWLATWIDAKSGLSGIPLISGDVDAGRVTLATIAGAVLTVAALVFSVMALMVQQAASQYSLRVVQGFLRDRVQQTVVGVVVGTFVYCLLILATIGDEGAAADPDAVSLAVTLGVVFAVVSMVAIVWFIDHMVRLIRVDTTVAYLTRLTTAAVEKLPEESFNPNDVSPPDGESRRIVASKAGWLQGINGQFLAAGLPPGSYLRLATRIGDHIAVGDTIGRVWASGDVTPAELDTLVREALAVHAVRTVEDDAGYGFQQLTDIALRALSTAINDPTTAADVVHQMAGPLRILLERSTPPKVIRGENGQVVTIPYRLAKTEYLWMTLGQIRVHSGHQPLVLNALVSLTGELANDLDARDFFSTAQILRDEGLRTIELAKASFQPADVAPILERAGELGLIPAEKPSST